MTTLYKMTTTEKRSSLSITFIYALRMLGLFIVLPVFSLEAAKLPGGNNAILVGLGMGIYGLTQGFLQTPFGIISDRWGRKKTITVGLIIFAVGSIWCALSTSMLYLIIGRCLQGAGAISAATTALLSDQTRTQVRTKAMAMVGISIALMFALSLVVAPILAHKIGLSGLFWIVTALSILAMLNVWFYVPEETTVVQEEKISWVEGMRNVLRDKTLLRLNLGVFILHSVQLSMWMAIPALLVRAGLTVDGQWKVYLPAVVIAFLVMGGGLFRLERKGYLRGVYLASIALLVIVQLGLMFISHSTSHPNLSVIFAMLCLFFLAFNTLEATQPSWVSRQAPGSARGTALGIYNSIQSFGIFVGGALGGVLVSYCGIVTLFGVAALALLVWLIVAWPIKAEASPIDTAKSK